jgi:3-oxoacyl-[acyl-carrier protein] reductase
MTPGAFEGRVALVTGAGSGIGREVSRRLALAGASVLLNDIEGQRAEEAARAIVAEGGSCRAAAGDVAEAEVAAALVAQAMAAFGRLDIVVANAGLTLYRSFLECRPEEFDRLLAVNLRGSYFLVQAAARCMRDAGKGGRVLLMSSVTGHRGIPALSAYGMTKAALEMMARALVMELSPLGITINALAPGATLTARTRADPEFARGWAEVTPSGRAAEERDVAEAALFLLSSAADQITGQTLVVDGGWTATGRTPPHP